MGAAAGCEAGVAGGVALPGSRWPPTHVARALTAAAAAAAVSGFRAESRAAGQTSVRSRSPPPAPIGGDATKFFGGQDSVFQHEAKIFSNSNQCFASSIILIMITSLS